MLYYPIYSILKQELETSKQIVEEEQRYKREGKGNTSLFILI
jgi:hypothetical protein